MRALHSSTFCTGAFMSGLAGYIGMWISVRAHSNPNPNPNPNPDLTPTLTRILTHTLTLTPTLTLSPTPTPTLTPTLTPTSTLTLTFHPNPYPNPNQVRANVRTAAAATRSYQESIDTALRGGAVCGLLVVGLCVFGLTTLFMLFRSMFPDTPSAFTPNLLVGFGFGASLVALFAQVGGGIYTKAADVGADLVGKVEVGIPEDDPRNPAVIADLVGDNVGDCAGRGADLFESISAEIIGATLPLEPHPTPHTPNALLHAPPHPATHSLPGAMLLGGSLATSLRLPEDTTARCMLLLHPLPCCAPLPWHTPLPCHHPSPGALHDVPTAHPLRRHGGFFHRCAEHPRQEERQRCALPTRPRCPPTQCTRLQPLLHALTAPAYTRLQPLLYAVAAPATCGCRSCS